MGKGSLLNLLAAWCVVHAEGKEKKYPYVNKKRKQPMENQSINNIQSLDTGDTHWYAMRVYMNKVVACRDQFLYLTSELSKGDGCNERIPDELKGPEMEYYAVFERVSHTTPGGKTVVEEKPLVPSLFFMKSSREQAEAFEKWMDRKVHLYRRLQNRKFQPVSIPLRQMQMFMMVSSGDQEGLEYFASDDFDWRKGERVRVIDGRFKGLEGEIKRINGNKRLVVAIEGICAVATTYIPRCFLEKL